MTIERARPEDAEMLTEIAFSAKQHWGYPESRREDLTIDPEFIRTHETFVAKQDSQIAAFYAIAAKAGRLHLLQLWVRPPQMQRGLGRSLFLHAVKRLAALGFRELETVLIYAVAPLKNES